MCSLSASHSITRTDLEPDGAFFCLVLCLGLGVLAGRRCFGPRGGIARQRNAFADSVPGEPRTGMSSPIENVVMRMEVATLTPTELHRFAPLTLALRGGVLAVRPWLGQRHNEEPHEQLKAELSRTEGEVGVKAGNRRSRTTSAPTALR